MSSDTNPGTTMNTETATPTTRTATNTSGPYSWPVVEIARWEVQIKRGGFWMMTGGNWHNTREGAEDDAARMVSIFGHAAADVRVVTGGWKVVRHATAEDIAQYGEPV